MRVKKVVRSQSGTRDDVMAAIAGVVSLLALGKLNTEMRRPFV